MKYKLAVLVHFPWIRSKGEIACHPIGRYGIGKRDGPLKYGEMPIKERMWPLFLKRNSIWMQPGKMESGWWSCLQKGKLPLKWPNDSGLEKYSSGWCLACPGRSNMELTAGRVTKFTEETARMRIRWYGMWRFPLGKWFCMDLKTICRGDWMSLTGETAFLFCLAYFCQGDV